MTHVFALASMAQEAGLDPPRAETSVQDLAQHGVSSLLGAFLDSARGGWWSSVSYTGVRHSEKTAYDHAFVLLAASSAYAAGVPGAGRLLDMALETNTARFWQSEASMVVDSWDDSWSVLSPYRGINANMHTVEAYLSATAVTGQIEWAERAAGIASRVVRLAHQHDYRLPEHFDESWRPLLDFNQDAPADPFRPFGATVGHAFEWARLLIGLAMEDVGGAPTADSLTSTAKRLTHRAIADGWCPDGAEGFIYTTDWSGQPVVAERMHWVVAEALNTAWMLRFQSTTDEYATERAFWWRYVDRHVIDERDGSWRHELDANLRPSSRTWRGRPDVYHAYQAALLPDLPLSSSFAGALDSLR